MATTTNTPAKANAAYNALSITRDTLVDALRDIEVQMSKLMTNESDGDFPSFPCARPSTPTNRSIANDSHWGMSTPKAQRDIVQPDHTNSSAILIPNNGTNRSAKKREYYENEFEEGNPTAKSSTMTTSPSEPSRSAKKVREGNETRSVHATSVVKTTPTANIKSKENPSPSKLDGLARALRSIRPSGHWTQLHVDDQSPMVPAAPENNTDEIILLEVRAKPFKFSVGSVATGDSRTWVFTRPGTVKLYRDKVTGHTRIMHRIESTGVVKLNLGVRGNMVNMEKVLLPKKIGFKHFGSVTFFAFESELGRMVQYRYMLKVQADMLDTLFEKLIEMGATVKNPN